MVSGLLVNVAVLGCLGPQGFPLIRRLKTFKFVLKYEVCD